MPEADTSLKATSVYRLPVYKNISKSEVDMVSGFRIRFLHQSLFYNETLPSKSSQRLRRILCSLLYLAISANSNKNVINMWILERKYWGRSTKDCKGLSSFNVITKGIQKVDCNALQTFGFNRRFHNWLAMNFRSLSSNYSFNEKLLCLIKIQGCCIPIENLFQTVAAAWAANFNV